MDTTPYKNFRSTFVAYSCVQDGLVGKIFGCTINILYLLTYLLTSAVSSPMMLWWLMKGWVSASPLICNAVVWIAGLVHVKKVGS